MHSTKSSANRNRQSSANKDQAQTTEGKLIKSIPVTETQVSARLSRVRCLIPFNKNKDYSLMQLIANV